MRICGSVVWCTGYTLNFQSLCDLPNLYGPRGYPIQARGQAIHHPGIFFLGLHWMHKWKSAIFCGIDVCICIFLFVCMYSFTQVHTHTHTHTGIAEDAEHVVDLALKRSPPLTNRMVPRSVCGLQPPDGQVVFLGKGFFRNS